MKDEEQVGKSIYFTCSVSSFISAWFPAVFALLDFCVMVLVVVVVTRDVLLATKHNNYMQFNIKRFGQSPKLTQQKMPYNDVKNRKIDLTAAI